MTNYKVSTVKEFIEASAKESQPHLREITGIIRSAIPEAEERIGYGKPYYKYNGWVAGIDVYKNHLGLEIWDGLTTKDRALLEEKGYKTGSKTFQIRYDQEIPAAIVKDLVKRQVKANETKAKNKK